jgi:hypothetical protein
MLGSKTLCFSRAASSVDVPSSTAPNETVRIEGHFTRVMAVFESDTQCT